MKTSTILIVLLFAFATKTSFFALAKTPVLDSDGDKVEPGVEYFVMSWRTDDSASGVYRDFDPVYVCPEIVAQHRWFMDDGLPVIFSTLDSSEDIVYENANVTLTFIPIRPRLCLTSTTWQVVHDKYSGKDVVSLGGVKGESAAMFTLRKFGPNAYKFNHLGSDIGRYPAEFPFEGYRLAVEKKFPWGWVFFKARNELQVTNE